MNIAPDKNRWIAGLLADDARDNARLPSRMAALVDTTGEQLYGNSRRRPNRHSPWVGAEAA
ncbi:MAG TPA: hypothetical protein VM555_10985 [Tahibacter sp.]|nr:hypothetical protein [Tahibacter sp.]